MAEGDVGAVAPIVPLVPASTDVPAPDSTADQGTDGNEAPDAPPERTFTQKELDEIVSKRAAQAERRARKDGRLEAERDFWRQQAEARTQQQQPPKTEPAGKPIPSQFQDYESFTEALAEWKVDQKLSKAREEGERAAREQQAQRSTQERVQSVQTNLVSVGQAKHSDFVEVTTADGVAITDAMLAAAERLKEAGAEALYHLGQYPEESQRIARLPDIEQVWELKDLATKLKAVPASTKTPAPIVPNRGSSAGSKSMLDMNQDEFEKHRKARLARK